jgi:uncharacterized protein (DUF1810 family)
VLRKSGLEARDSRLGQVPGSCRVLVDAEYCIQRGDAMPGLERFKQAQDRPDSGFEAALAEVGSGHKQGHWIWYVFPQLSGLGASRSSQIYGISDLAEAVEYLRDPVLRSRLLTITTAVSGRARGSRLGARGSTVESGKAVTLETLMGSSVDVRKLVCSLTLFGNVARTLHAAEGLGELESLARVAEEVLAVAASQGYPPCPYTIARLA